MARPTISSIMIIHSMCTIVCVYLLVKSPVVSGKSPCKDTLAQGKNPVTDPEQSEQMVHLNAQQETKQKKGGKNEAMIMQKFGKQIGSCDWHMVRKL